MTDGPTKIDVRVSDTILKGTHQASPSSSSSVACPLDSSQHSAFSRRVATRSNQNPADSCISQANDIETDLFHAPSDAGWVRPLPAESTTNMSNVEDAQNNQRNAWGPEKDSILGVEEEEEGEETTCVAPNRLRRGPNPQLPATELSLSSPLQGLSIHNNAFADHEARPIRAPQHLRRGDFEPTTALGGASTESTETANMH